jgi:hypothetical protein
MFKYRITFFRKRIARASSLLSVSNSWFGSPPPPYCSSHVTTPLTSNWQVSARRFTLGGDR